ncbi:MAG: hypothetical protein HZB65_02235 [Candidatus Aenigmarchaeota archaeon]|nr:hypothetical protein [Candidatus Aenigmarchaeota archaeon]
MKVSKHMIIVAVVTVIIAGTISAMVFIKPDPEKVVVDAIEKQLNVTDYTTEYNLSYQTKSGGVTLDAKGMITVFKTPDATKVTLSLDTFGEKIRIDQYQTGNETIQCMSSLFNTTCKKADSSSMPVNTPEEQAKALQNLIKTNVLKLKYLSEKNIAGRTCDEVQTSYNPSQLGSESGASNNIDVVLCLDKEKGIPLEMLMNLAISSEDSLDVKMTLTEISFDKVYITVPEVTEEFDEFKYSS